MAVRDPKLYFYDTIAGRFDELVNAYDCGGGSKSVRRDARRRGPGRPSRSLTSAAAVDGSVVEAQRRGARVTSLDIALQLLHETRRKVHTDRVNADACALPFADGSFDLVMSSECIEHTPIRASRCGNPFASRDREAASRHRAQSGMAFRGHHRRDVQAAPFEG